MFGEIEYDVCQGREKLLSDNLPMFLFSDNLTMFLISLFQICFDASPGQPHIQSIEIQIFFSYKIILGIINNTVNFDHK